METTMQTPHDSTAAKSVRASDASAMISAASMNSDDVIASVSLLGQKGVCIIVHNAEQYILRRTRNNKLILTK
jgi:hemin uptake protein HemP